MDGVTGSVRGPGRQGWHNGPTVGRRQTIYWRLLDRQGRTIGFARDRAGKVAYVTLLDDRWHEDPILYDDRVKLSGPLESFAYLR